MNRTRVKNFTLQRQKGVALVISLILLTVITMLSLTAMRSANLDTKIAINHQHKQYAFQAAENALATLTSNPLETLETRTTEPQLVLPGTDNNDPVDNLGWYSKGADASSGNPGLTTDLAIAYLYTREGLKISGYGLNTKSPVYQADSVGRVNGTNATVHNRMEVALIRY